MKINIFFTILIWQSIFAFSKFEQKHNIIQGNKQYKKNKFQQAKTLYINALKKNYSNKYIENYNLGNTLYKQKNFDNAEKQFKKSIKEAKNINHKFKSYYNLGTNFLAKKNYLQAIKNFKNALKLYPHDFQTRYNYKYAINKNEKQKKEDKNRTRNTINKNEKKKKNTINNYNDILEIINQYEQKTQKKIFNKINKQSFHEEQPNW